MGHNDDPYQLLVEPGRVDEMMPYPVNETEMRKADDVIDSWDRINRVPVDVSGRAVISVYSTLWLYRDRLYSV